MLRGKVRATREVLEAAREFLVPKILRSMKLGSLPEANSEFSPENCWLEDENSFFGQKPGGPECGFFTNMTQSRPKFFGGCCWPMWQVFSQRSVKFAKDC